MEKLKKIATSVKEGSPLAWMFEQGITVEEVKSEIVDHLSRFFTNQDVLEKFAIDFLVSDWINLIRLEVRFPYIETRIESITEYYNEAKLRDSNQVFSLMSKTMPLHVEAGNRFWSFLNLEIDKTKLDLEEYVSASMRNLVDLIEGLSKSLLIENLGIDRINRGKKLNIDKLIKLNLGVIVDELVNNSPFQVLFKPSPFDLRVSDWRNIGAHHSYKIRGDDICCEYGPADNKKTVTLKKMELKEIVEGSVEMLSILTVAHKFFAYDNVGNLSNTIPLQSLAETRIENDFLTFASAASSQGFEIIDIKFEIDEEALIVLRDLTTGDPMQRGIHSSQIIFQLWLLTKSKNLTIEYQQKNGELFFRSTSTSEICEKFERGELDIRGYANNVQFQFGDLLKS